MPIMDDEAWPRLPGCCICGHHSYTMQSRNGKWYCYNHLELGEPLPDSERSDDMEEKDHGVHIG